jgi:hypothetical protein
MCHDDVMCACDCGNGARCARDVLALNLRIQWLAATCQCGAAQGNNNSHPSSSKIRETGSVQASTALMVLMRLAVGLS